MPDPTRPSREAREAAARLWLRLPDYHRLDRRAEVDIARALDDFAEKWREEAAISGRAIEIVYETLGANPREIEVVKRIQELNAAEQERDALRQRIDQAVDILGIAALDGHFGEDQDVGLARYSIKRIVGLLAGGCDPGDEVFTGEPLCDTIAALRERVAALEAVVAKPDPNTRLRDAASAIMENIKACDEQPDDEGHCSCARTILSWLRHYELHGTRWRELHDEQKARAERAEKALDDVIALQDQEHTPTDWLRAMIAAVEKAKEARRARGET